MSALFQSFTALSLSSRGARGDSRVASPSTRAMPTPQKRTAVVTEAVRSFSRPFFLSLSSLFFCIQGGTCVLESRRRSTTTRAREGAMDASPAVFRGRRRFEFDFGRRALVRIDGWTVLPAKRAVRKDTKKNFIRERDFRFLRRPENPPPLFYVKNQKRQQNTKD